MNHAFVSLLRTAVKEQVSVKDISCYVTKRSDDLLIYISLYMCIFPFFMAFLYKNTRQQKELRDSKASTECNFEVGVM